MSVTMLGWLVIAGSAALSIISFISLLMVLAGSHGTQSADLKGFLLVVVAPPVTVLAGVGLVRRWRWAWLYLVAGLLAVLAWNVFEMTRPPEPAETTYTSASGVKTTVFRSSPSYSIRVMALCVFLLGFALTRRVRREFGFVRDRSPLEPWLDPPQSWVGHRRDEITTGNKAQPDAQDVPPAAVTVGTLPQPRSIAPNRPSTGRQMAALLLFITVLLALAGGMGWLVRTGLEENEIPLPSAKPTQRRAVLREKEPALFWFSLGLYAAVGTGSLGLAVWMGAHGWIARLGRQKHGARHRP